MTRERQVRICERLGAKFPGPTRRIGYSGHKHQKGEKVLAIVENNGFVVAPLPVAPVNEADTVLLPDGLNALKRVARLTDLKIDGSYRPQLTNEAPGTRLWIE
jgi:K+/H+ antiporter YhaU regulatory subunit KhtT